MEARIDLPDSGRLLSPLQFYPRLNLLAAAQDDDGYLVAGTLAAERIRKVIKIVDSLAVELHENVAGLKSRFCRGAVVLHTRELDAFFLFPKIGNGAEVRSISSGLRFAVPFVSADVAVVAAVALYWCINRPLVRRVDALQDQADQLQHPGSFLRLQLVPSVRRFVVVGMQSGEEKDHGNI